MMKTVNGDFVQFYTTESGLKGSPGRYGSSDGLPYYSLCNGFSYVMDEASPRWIDLDKKDQFEPKNENVYVSVWYPDHQKAVLEWAVRFPDVTFTVGGPEYFFNTFNRVSCESKAILDKKWPKNYIISTGLAEDLFSKDINLKNWKLDFPHASFQNPDMSIEYAYYIGVYCYWGSGTRGCSFCARPARDLSNDKRRRLIGYNIEPLWDAPKGTVFFSPPAVTPSMLLDILPKLNYTDKTYWMFMRAGQKEYKALKSLAEDKNVNMEKIIFSIGVEFPSERMLKRMNKGVTVHENIQMINFLDSVGSGINTFYITGWPNLTVEDIKEAELFFEKIDCHNSDRVYYNLGKLSRAFISTDDNGNPLRKIDPGDSLSETDFFLPHLPVLSEKDREINDKWIELLNTKKLVYQRRVNKEE